MTIEDIKKDLAERIEKDELLDCVMSFKYNWQSNHVVALLGTFLVAYKDTNGETKYQHPDPDSHITREGTGDLAAQYSDSKLELQPLQWITYNLNNDQIMVQDYLQGDPLTTMLSGEVGW